MAFDVNIVREQAARHGWLSILAELAPTLETATQKVGQHVPCPVEGGVDGFRLFKDAVVTGGGISNKAGALADGFAVLQFATGVSFKGALTLVANYLGLTEEKVLYAKPRMAPVSAPSFELSKKEKLARKGKLNNFWGQGSFLTDNDRVMQYLQSRGIKGGWIAQKLGNVRLHPSAWYKDANGNQASAPAMLLKFHNKDGMPCNVHKTFLSTVTAGKAEIDEPKLMMKPTCKMTGGAVRIGGIDDIVANNGVLHVSEGFENSATIADVHSQPSWATLNWALLQGFMPPTEVKTMFIWADNDPLDSEGRNAGYDAAKKLQNKLKNLRPDMKVFIKLPPKKKEDWNDLYQMGRMDLFSLENV